MTDPVSLPDMTFNPRAHIDTRRIGNDGMPVLVIDDVLLHPEQMVDYAIAQGNFAPPPGESYYPGINGTLPPHYGPALVTALRPAMEGLFHISRQERLEYEGFFGLSTLTAGQLAPLQTIPHFDSNNPRRLAMVHYFCRPPFQGTAFYRHKATGFESINGSRVDQYRSLVMVELEAAPRDDFIFDDTDHYSRIDYVEARFNRLVLYSTTMLHSGILGGAPLTADPATGRLTANSFVEKLRV